MRAAMLTALFALSLAGPVPADQSLNVGELSSKTTAAVALKSGVVGALAMPADYPGTSPVD